MKVTNSKEFHTYAYRSLNESIPSALSVSLFQVVIHLSTCKILPFNQLLLTLRLMANQLSDQLPHYRPTYTYYVNRPMEYGVWSCMLVTSSVSPLSRHFRKAAESGCI